MEKSQNKVYNSFAEVYVIVSIDKKQLIKDMATRYYEARKRKELTQEEAAELADVTQQTISKAELGKGLLSADCIIKLCRAYEISCDYLLTGKITDNDSVIIDKQIKELDEQAFTCYKTITESFLKFASKK